MLASGDHIQCLDGRWIKYWACLLWCLSLCLLQADTEKKNQERKIQLLEEDLDKAEERITELNQKNSSLEAAADETER